MSHIQKSPCRRQRRWWHRQCRWSWYGPVAARGVVQGVYATTRPDSWRGHSTPTMCLCGGFKDPYGSLLTVWENTMRGREKQTEAELTLQANLGKRQRGRGEECELWGCQPRIMRRVCNTEQPGTNENTLTSAQNCHALCQHWQNIDNVSMHSDLWRANPDSISDSTELWTWRFY